MKLKDVFPGSSAGRELLEKKAPGFDHLELFTASVREWPAGPRYPGLLAAMDGMSREMCLRAGIEAPDEQPTPSSPEPPPPVWAAQQPYMDYSLGVAAKLDALSSLSGHCLAWFGFAEYDTIGSDRLISRSELPSTLDTHKDALLPVRLHPAHGRHQKKDMRCVPPPDRDKLQQVGLQLRANLKTAFKYILPEVSTSQRRELYERLDLLMEDYEFARLHAENVSEFNVIASTRWFRRLGYRGLLGKIGLLLAGKPLIDTTAETLGRAIRENRLFVGSINEALGEGQGLDLRVPPREPGFLPLFMTDARSGNRFPLRLERTGADHFLTSSDKEGFRVNIGRAADQQVKELLLQYEGRWSPNVFMPIYLFQAGFCGCVTGKSSIKYAVVMGHVLERLYERKHPPNLLCAGAPSPEGLLHEAVQARWGKLPDTVASYGPSLVYRLICSGPEKTTEEIARLWRS